MLEISQKSQRVIKRKVFSLSCRLIAMESDTSNEMITKNKSTIFVLGEDQVLYHIREDKLVEREFNLIGEYDYTGYDMRAIANNFWSRCHMTKGAITYDEYLYQANSANE